MKKSCLFLIFAFLFIVSCSGSDDAPIACITAGDCPDSSYSCFDGWCVVANLGNDDEFNGGNSSGNDLPDESQNEGGDSTENGDNDKENTNDSEHNEPVTDDKDGHSDADSASDSDQASDSDNAETPDSETPDGNGGEEDPDKENGEGNGDGDPSLNDNENSSDDTDTAENGDGDSSSSDNENTNDDDSAGNGGESSENHGDPTTTCEQDSDCAGNLNRTRCNGGICVICLSNDDCDTALGQNCDLSTHECVSNATCAAAIAKLPHGGKFDWEDGTTQGFSTNTYWDLVESSVLPARSGNYSFGKYSQYTVNKDQISPLSTATDLSQCAQCTVKASFYVKGQICNGNCEAQTFLHPTCNGEGNTTVVDKTVTTWSQWTIPPESPWVKDDLDFFKAKANNNQYSAVAWKDLEWTIPETCKTDQFVFALRFRSSSLVAGPGLVVDDLTIEPAATDFVPNGEFESATNGYVKGWACDLDSKNKNVLVKVEYYKNKDESVAAAERWVYAKLLRPDDSALQIQCGETYNHGFEVPFDNDLRTVLGAGTHSAAVFAVDIPSADTHCAGTYTKLDETKEFEISESDPK